MTGFDVTVASGLTVTEPPTAQALQTISEDLDPLGLRRLGFVPSSGRADLTDEVLGTEERSLGIWPGP